MTPSPLYPRLAGEVWSQLDAAVRAFHLDPQTDRLCARGSFAIRHGGAWLARCLARLLRMPAEGDAIEARLVVSRDGDKERWHRTFAGQPMVTVQEARPGPLLAEQLGLLELRFRLEAEGGALVYRQVGTQLRLGPLSLPLPRRFSPQAAAREEAGRAGRIRVTVDVSLPLIGRLISYAGELEWERVG